MFHLFLFLGLAFNVLAQDPPAPPPPLVGGFSPFDINDEVKGVAAEVLDQLPSFIGSSDKCVLKIEKIHEAQTQVVAGTNYLLTMEISTEGDGCLSETKVCKNIKIYKPLPFACESRIDSCLELMETENIQCRVPEDDIEISTLAGPPVLGGLVRIDNPEEQPEIKALAQKASQYLYHLLNTTTACPIHLRSIESAKQQVMAGINYELDITVETDGANYNCEYVQLSCSNIMLHRPLGNCPNEEETCTIPVGLSDVECVEINQIFN